MKFAYLIMAHDNEEQLKLLINALDYRENEIYLHVDKKSKLDCLSFSTKKASLHVYKRFSVYWGDISQTKCQFFLLNEAIKSYHDYYHLISGHDFPIKSHKEIMAFFEKNKGKQFIHFESNEYCLKETCRYYHFLAALLSRCRNGYIKKIISRVEKILINIQRKCHVRREIYCGANWYSVTHELAQELCLRQKEVLKKVRWTISSDEYVLQTFYRSIATGNYELFSETREPTDYHATAREIDWHRGNPYVWRSEDYGYLSHSERMYARKFDQKIDGEIIKNILEFINAKQES